MVCYVSFLFADQSLKKDRDFILKVIEYGCSDGSEEVLRYTDDSLLKDKEVILKAFKFQKERNTVIKYVDNSLMKDKEIILKAIEMEGGSYF